MSCSEEEFIGLFSTLRLTVNELQGTLGFGNEVLKK
jgi:hypothetical protein